MSVTAPDPQISNKLRPIVSMVEFFFKYACCVTTSKVIENPSSGIVLHSYSWSVSIFYSNYQFNSALYSNYSSAHAYMHMLFFRFIA